ncbi:LptF/LptG family permease [Thalassoroseus pseudoceratinae]|uniref:LptF/LptG family permease n=1 Tax=Thalassoroseus pseudoceratinae TaxID=2713176 RepID=UPI0014203622|nr:LptF/LptG family permease [Thalassoroseus pseudoceratinae]
MASIFDRYLLRRYLSTFFILFISTYGLYVVIDGFSNVDDFQIRADGTGEMLQAMAKHYGYQSTAFFNMMAPILAIISVLVVVAMLYKQTEITPMLSAGVPVSRLLRPFIAGAVLVNVMAWINQDVFIPRFAPMLQAGRGEAGEKGKRVEPVYDYVSHICIDGERLFYHEQRIQDAHFVLPVPEVAEELTTLSAESATFFEATDDRPAGWLLQNLTTDTSNLKLTDTGNRLVRSVPDSSDLFIVSDVSFDQLSNRNRSYKYIPTSELIQRIRNPAFGSSSVRAQLMHLHLRFVAPIANVLCIFVAVPLVIRRESRSLVTNMAVCTGCLGVLYGLSMGCEYLGQVNLLRPDMAAWSPAIVTGTLGAWLSGLAQT